MTASKNNVYNKAKDAIQAINSASSITRTLFISLMSLSAYLAVVIASTTDMDLLLYSPLKLPIIGVEIDLKGFYTWTPWLYLVIHAYTLLNLSLLTDKLDYFDECCVRLDYDQRLHLRKQLHVHSFTQYIGAHNEGMVKLSLNLLNWFTMTVLPLGILLFLLFDFLPAQETGILWGQRWAIIIDAVLCCLFWNVILQKRRKARLPKGWKPPIWKRFTHSGLSLFLVALFTVYLAVFVAVIPLSAWERQLQSGEFFGSTQLSWYDVIYEGRGGDIAYCVKDKSSTDGSKEIDKVESKYLCESKLHNDSQHDLLVEDWNDQIISAINNRLNEEKCIEWTILDRGCMTWFLFDRENSFLDLHRHLTIVGEILTANELDSEVKNNLVEYRDSNLKLEQDSENYTKTPEILDKINPIDLSRRWFRFANFTRAILPKAILDYAHLQGGNFNYSLLTGLSPNHTYFQNAKLHKTQLQTGEFNQTYFQNADLSNSKLSRSNLDSVNLINTNLTFTDFSAATISESSLLGSTLKETIFSNVTFSNIKLDDLLFEKVSADNTSFIQSTFEATEFFGGNFSNAQLVKAEFFKTRFNGVFMGEANFYDATFKEVLLEGYFGDANFSSSFFLDSELKGRFNNSSFQHAELRSVKLLERASFRRTDFSTAEFSDSVLGAGDFTAANLSSISFQNTDITDALFDLAIVSFKQKSQIIGKPTASSSWPCIFSDRRYLEDSDLQLEMWRDVCLIDSFENSENRIRHAELWSLYVLDDICFDPSRMRDILNLNIWYTGMGEGLSQLSNVLQSFYLNGVESFYFNGVETENCNIETLKSQIKEYLETRKVSELEDLFEPDIDDETPRSPTLLQHLIYSLYKKGHEWSAGSVTTENH